LSSLPLQTVGCYNDDNKARARNRKREKEKRREMKQNGVYCAFWKQFFSMEYKNRNTESNNEKK